MSAANIVIIGAGVAGLTTALLLSRKGHNVTIVAKHHPGDLDIEYTSPWAGANFLPMAEEGTEHMQWEASTYPELIRLATEVPECGIHLQDAYLYNRDKDNKPDMLPWLKNLLSVTPWYKSVVHGFRQLHKDELPAGYDSGTKFGSVCINTVLYLPWLVSQCTKNGVVLKRAVLRNINEAAGLHSSGKKADVVVNCAGLGANNLGGVNDKTLIPARGQTILVRNVAPAMYCTSGTDDKDSDVCYIMSRAAGGGTIIGGSYQKGNYSPEIDYNLANRIMKRAIEVCPELVPNGKGVNGLDIIRMGAGLRPFRSDGPRVEKETINGLKVVHNYGAAGFGYQASYGMSQRTVDLIEESLAAKARL